jgi:hypothetical protein
MYFLITVRKYMGKSKLRRKYFFWLKKSKGSVHGWLAPLFLGKWLYRKHHGRKVYWKKLLTSQHSGRIDRDELSEIKIDPSKSCS